MTYKEITRRRDEEKARHKRVAIAALVLVTISVAGFVLYKPPSNYRLLYHPAQMAAAHVR